MKTNLCSQLGRQGEKFLESNDIMVFIDITFTRSRERKVRNCKAVSASVKE